MLFTAVPVAWISVEQLSNLWRIARPEALQVVLSCTSRYRVSGLPNEPDHNFWPPSDSDCEPPARQCQWPISSYGEREINSSRTGVSVADEALFVLSPTSGIRQMDHGAVPARPQQCALHIAFDRTQQGRDHRGFEFADRFRKRLSRPPGKPLVALSRSRSSTGLRHKSIR